MKKIVLLLVLISTTTFALPKSGKDIPDKDVEALYVKLMQTKTVVDVGANPMLNLLYTEYKNFMNDMLKVYTKNNVEDMPNWLLVTEKRF